MAKRIRQRLVPEGCVECFEVRVVCYFDEDGVQYTDVGISDPDARIARPPIHEVQGALWRGLTSLEALYEDAE